MIDELHVRNLALIEDAVLRPAPGLTVLSGETGAGKSALLGAAKLLAGDRADSSAVREGQKEAVVEARFVGLPANAEGDDELVVSRRVGADGRSRCTVDGAMAPVRQLASQVRPLLELCGQHEHQTLLDPASHASYLDGWAGAESRDALSSYRAALAAANQAQRALDQVVAASQASAADLDVARFTIEQIEQVDPQEGEEEQLTAELPALQHAEELAQGVSAALSDLRRDGGAVDALAQAAQQVRQLADIDPALAGTAELLESAAAQAEDAAGDLRSYRDGIEFDPRRPSCWSRRRRRLRMRRATCVRTGTASSSTHGCWRSIWTGSAHSRGCASATGRAWKTSLRAWRQHGPPWPGWRTRASALSQPRASATPPSTSLRKRRAPSCR